MRAIGYMVSLSVPPEELPEYLRGINFWGLESESLELFVTEKNLFQASSEEDT